MLDEAFREIAGAVSAAFDGPYFDAVLHYAGTPVYDDGGSIVTPGTPSRIECTVQVDNVTETMRLDADFLARDVRLLILGPAALDTKPEVEMLAGPHSGRRFSLRSVDRDSMGFAWDCRGRGL